MRHHLIAIGLAALIAVGPMAAVPAQAAPLPAAVTCTGVWVVVDYGALGGTSTKCATSFSTGTKALRSAGFSVVIDGGFISKIGGKPSNPDPNKAYWSYWHATRQADGSYSAWDYSNLGADDYHPAQGNAEGWRYQSLSEGKAAPQADPPTAVAAEPSPTPTKASTQPTKKATSRATTSASATATPRSSAPTAASTPTPSPAQTATATSATADTPSTDVSAVAAEAPSAIAPPPASGTPVGTIAAGVAILVAAGGLGGWWLLRGRRR